MREKEVIRGDTIRETREEERNLERDKDRGIKADKAAPDRELEREERRRGEVRAEQCRL